MTTTSPEPDDGSSRRGTGDLTSDSDRVLAVSRGSEDALADLYDRHGTAVFAAAMRASNDRSIAAEVVQETFLALWNRAEMFDESRGSLGAWLVTIARNRAIDRLRAAGRHNRAMSFSAFRGPDRADGALGDRLAASGALIAAGRPEVLPEVALANKEARASIVDALASLAPPERRVIALAYDGGLSQSEIAASLGWPIGTVKTRTRRALRHLRDQLELPPGGSPARAKVPDHASGLARRSANVEAPRHGLGGCVAPC
jgi:RNA polymerase sigma-70 factor, ECF subfamily